MQGATFTPSVLERDELERLFVSRSHLLDLALAKISAASSSTARSHVLFVGPRGAGKTHLVSLIYYQAQDVPGYGTAFQLAWLPEDPWAVDSFDDLVGEIVRNLEPGPAGAGIDGLLTAVRDRGPVVVFAENLDQVLDQIGPAGQRQLRAVIENDRALLIIGTATRLSRDLLHQAVPFYGFFDVVDLPAFGVDEALALLRAMAVVRGDQDLPGRLDDPDIRARLLAVQQLAGGQPRIWALLGAGLTAARLDDLAATLAQSFDDLTPYYQEQLARLSRHERRVVRFLVDADRSLTVRGLAEASGIEAKSVARTMTDLRRRGWVQPRAGLLTQFVDKRLTHYDLAEPLLRLVLQINQTRGRPIPGLVRFLTAWFRVVAGQEPDPDRWAADPPAGWDAELIDRIWRIDDALALLQHDRDASAVLGLPSAISLAVEQGLSDRGEQGAGDVGVAAALLRLRLGRLAILGGLAAPWLPRGHDAAGALHRAPELSSLARAEAEAGSPRAAAVWSERAGAVSP